MAHLRFDGVKGLLALLCLLGVATLCFLAFFGVAGSPTAVSSWSAPGAYGLSGDSSFGTRRLRVALVPCLTSSTRVSMSSLPW